MRYLVDADISQAHTLPTSFYTDPTIYKRLINEVFFHAWQWIGDSDMLPETGFCYPFELLEGSLGEPLVLSRDKNDEIHCLSNICTHRGNILVQEMGTNRMLSCNYHGRCFGLDGQFRSMPEFKEAKNFPTQDDHLPQLPLKKLGKLLFTSLDPRHDFEEVIKPIKERLTWFPFGELTYSHQHSKTYELDAHWALYCDNYLEGFHVPFVHPALNESLSYQDYETVVYDHGSLQLGVASEDSPYFDLPKDAPDFGKKIHAYYYWLFPNIMLNIYTWGISMNVVEPLGISKTRVQFQTYLLPNQEAKDFADQRLHETEMEDEAVVLNVQKGIQSKLYKRGRFSPKREQGVHHFHRLLANWLNRPAE